MANKEPDIELGIKYYTSFFQRKNLSAEAFLKLNDIIIKNFYKEVEFLGFKNRRLLAVDGGFLNLPNHLQKVEKNDIQLCKHAATNY